MSNQSSSLAPSHPLIIAIIVATASFSINGAIPILDAAGPELGVSEPARTISTIFIFGYGIGHFLIGSIVRASSAQLALVLGIIGFTIASVWSAMSVGSFDLQLSSFFQGLCISVCPILGRLLAWQRTSREASARTLSLATSIFTWMPVLAPICTFLILQQFGWRWGYVVLGLYGVLALAAVRGARIDTTNAPTFGHRNPMHAIARAFQLLKKPDVLTGLFSVAASFSGFFLFLTAASEILRTSTAMSASKTALATSLIAGSFAIGGVLSRSLLHRWSSQEVLERVTLFMAITAAAWVIVSVVDLGGYFLLMLAIAFCSFAGAIIPNATIKVLSNSGDEPIMSLALIGGLKMLVAAATSAVALQQGWGLGLDFGLVILLLGITAWAPIWLRNMKS